MGVCIYTFCFAMSRIVRTSKYRHVFGTAEKRENCFDGVKVSGGAWDSNKVAAGNSFVAAIWEAGGGGSFAVLGNDQTGKLGEIPLVTGHKGKVLDVAFSRFNDNLVASVSEDGNGRIWAIPEGGLKENLVDPVQTLILTRERSDPSTSTPLLIMWSPLPLPTTPSRFGTLRRVRLAPPSLVTPISSNPSTGTTMVASSPPPPRTRRSVSSILVEETLPERPLVTLVSRDPAASGSVSVEPSSTLVSLALLIVLTPTPLNWVWLCAPRLLAMFPLA